jgi:hypothetical protein
MITINPVLFEENQRFREIEFFILLGILQLIFLWGLTQQVILHKTWGHERTPDEILIAINLFLLALLLLFNSINLKTVITEKHILFKMTPFHIKDKILDWTEVKDVKVIKYDGMKEYSRYQLGFKSSNSRIYTVVGFYGIRIILNNEKKILIGTHREKEIAQIINDLITKGIINKKI